jgi:tRNA-splicing ligase RtcB (3'-phosphate/5'-hydroxy nucleic acid ligase)
MSILKTKELSKIGYTNDQARSLALNITAKHYKHHSKAELVTLLSDIRNKPQDFVHDSTLGKIAAAFTDGPVLHGFETYSLMKQPGPYKVYGSKEIEAAAKKQMDMAMSLPVAVQGALMPDAHTGFGLPIGGVLATRNAVIPFAVGVDIGCRMALTIIDESDSFFKSNGHRMKQALREHTHFGMEGGLETIREHEVLDSPLFSATALLKRLQGKAAKQLGTSGGGNHFVEFGTVELREENGLGLQSKKYLALLSHSGSRGLGANIAQHYTRIAMDTCKLPREAQQLAGLDINSEAGQEYWLSMNLAGDYARACHDSIHATLLRALGLRPLAVIGNHHNFAWKETMQDGSEAIIHRKGATPAHAGEWGIIPGSMTDVAYLVTGNGMSKSLNSASHGAGRAMSRQRAKENMTASGLKQLLGKAGVQLIGGSVEENPLAYKDIDTVMAAQKELVTIQGKFYPKIVRMNKD